MSGEVLGAVIVLWLCGLVFPITLLLAALALDGLLVAWALFRTWHDGWWPAAVRWLRQSTWTLAARPRPHW